MSQQVRVDRAKVEHFIRVFNRYGENTRMAPTWGPLHNQRSLLQPLSIDEATGIVRVLVLEGESYGAEGDHHVNFLRLVPPHEEEQCRQWWARVEEHRRSKGVAQ